MRGAVVHIRRSELSKPPYVLPNSVWTDRDRARLLTLTHQQYNKAVNGILLSIEFWILISFVYVSHNWLHENKSPYTRENIILILAGVCALELICVAMYAGLVGVLRSGDKPLDQYKQRSSMVIALTSGVLLAVPIFLMWYAVYPRMLLLLTGKDWLPDFGGGYMDYAATAGFSLIILVITSSYLRLWRALYYRIREHNTFGKTRFRCKRINDQLIKFSMSNGYASASTPMYRVHLNFVEEQVVSIRSGDDEKLRLVRHYTSHSFWDVSPVELSRGMDLTINPNTEIGYLVDDYNLKNPKYWEVLVQQYDQAYMERCLVGGRNVCELID